MYEGNTNAEFIDSILESNNYNLVAKYKMN
jgi:hypothetical protein